MKHLVKYILIFIISCQSFGQDTLELTFERAKNIALNESYTIKTHLANKEAMQYYFMYHKAQFKPSLDFDLFAPNWEESVSQINRPDSLPVFNSTGSIRAGGDLNFTYIIPTGGNFALHSTIYQENLTTVLTNQDYNKLNANQAFAKLGISFDQPLFTKNTLKENLKEAEYQYQRASNYYTKGQMDIIYNVTEGFYALYRATRVMEIDQEKLKNSKEAYRVAKLKLKAKRIAEAELLIAEVEMEQDKANLSESITKLKEEKNRFKQLIGVDLDQAISIVTSIKYDSFYIDENIAVDKAIQNRLELDNADLDIKLQEIEVDRAEREYEFKGNISGYYNLTGLGMMDEAKTGKLFKRAFNNFVDRPPNRGVTFTLSIPIYDWGRGPARVQQEKAYLEDAKLDRENIEITIKREVMDIVRKVANTRERLIIYEKNQRVAKHSYDISKLRFENGDITSQELAQEQERLYEVQLAYLDTYITYKLALADLKRNTMWNFKEGRSYLIGE